MKDYNKAGLEVIRERASLLDQLRWFFAQQKVFEVQIPVLSKHTVTDPEINSIMVPGLSLIHI